MFFSKANQTLYLTNWNYNAVLIIEELKRIISNNGGLTKDTTPGFIVNRSLMDCANEYRIKAARVRESIEAGEVENNERRENYIRENERKAAELEAIPNDPRPVTNNSYLRFVLDNTCYYIELDDNPFFDFYFNKTPIEAGTYSKDTYSEKLDKSFLWDCFLSVNATDADRREAANIIFNFLVSAKNCGKHIEKTRRRVSNTYNSGYHYETVYSKERREKVDLTNGWS